MAQTIEHGMEGKPEFDVDVHYVFTERAESRIREICVERRLQIPLHVRYPAPSTLVPSDRDLVELLDVAPGLLMICQGRKHFFSPHGQRIEVVLDLFEWDPDKAAGA